MSRRIAGATSRPAPPHPGSRANMSKPRLKRSAKSHYNLPSGMAFAGPIPAALAMPAARTRTGEFNFAKPLTCDGIR